MLMMGREAELPIDLIYGPHPQQDILTENKDKIFDYIDKLMQRLWSIHNKARHKVIESSSRQKRHYNLKFHQNQYKIGDPVWLYVYPHMKGVTTKLTRNWDGPYFIITAYSDVVYKIQKGPNTKFHIVHHDRLKPYYGKVNNWIKSDSVDGKSKH